jgi:TfoX/Sxy family transcriptional regulator of competence genes
MASEQKFVDFVCDQMRKAGQIASRKMFGEYAIYCDSKVVALVCDNQLFVKPSTGGKALLDQPQLASPYPGAKSHFLIDDRLDDAEWLTQLIATTARELPTPKPKKKKPSAKGTK